MLEAIKDISSFHGKRKIYRLIQETNDFELIFFITFNEKSFGNHKRIITDTQELRSKDQDLADALSLLKVAMKMLQTFSDDGWNDLLADVCCNFVKGWMFLYFVKDLRSMSRIRMQSLCLVKDQT